MRRALVRSIALAACTAPSPRRNSGVGALLAAVALLAAACEGVISDADQPPGNFGPNGAGFGGAGNGGSGIGGSGAGLPGGPSGGPANPSLDAIATSYFPGQAMTNGPKRLSRLTRTQLDATTKTLLPKQYGASPSAVATLPRDPLQTNYEYADNLSFNAANFTPYTHWVTNLVAGVKAAPQDVIDCGATGNSPACLVEQSKKFVSRAFRGVASDAQLTRFSDFFTASSIAAGNRLLKCFSKSKAVETRCRCLENDHEMEESSEVPAYGKQAAQGDCSS